MASLDDSAGTVRDDGAPELVRRAIAENQLGRFAAALASSEEAIRQGLGGAVPYLCAAYATARLTGNAVSLAWLDRALAIEPRNVLALAMRSEVMQAIARSGESLDDLTLAHTHRALGNDEEALRAFARAADRLPPCALTLTDWAILQLELGRRETALPTLERALLVDPEFASAWYTRAQSKVFSRGDPDLEAMESLLRRKLPSGAPRPADALILLHYALAKAYGDLALGPAALAHLEAGSRLKRAQFAYDPDIDARLAASMAAAFPASTVERLRGGGNPSPLPLFILGMPRSGSTLVEQILASHPGVRAGGETLALVNLVAELGGGYPHAAELSPARVAELARRYLASLPAAGAALRVTDKMPHNFLHVGLIHAMFPEARIVHCVRDPLDTCVSCYATLFTRGHEYSYDLTELGRYYRGYAGLMAHWQAVVPPDRLLAVRYEAVVDDLEGQARRLLAHCGLTWSDACLSFHDTQRPVRSASLHQVREPLYRRSLGRAALFGDALNPLRRALGAAGASEFPVS